TRMGVALVNERSLYWRLDGPSNLAFFARVRGMRSRLASAQAAELIAALGLDQVARRPVRTWSAGERQRLVIARAFLGNPDVLLLDEPTRGMDADGVARLGRMLAGARAEGKSVVLA